MNVIAPTTAPQVHVLALAGIQHPLAGEVLNALRPYGQTPVSLWKIINSLADARQPGSRTMRRCWRLRYWGAVRELRRAGLLFRHGSLIALKDFATKPKPRSPTRLAPSVGRSTSENSGSVPLMARVETSTKHEQTVRHELTSGNAKAFACAPETKSAMPTASEIKAAASALARRPRNVKRSSRRSVRLIPACTDQ